MAGSKPTVYWDACVFVAFLKGDKPAEAIKEGVRYWSDRARRGEVQIITSTITYTEILRFHHETQYRGFLEFMRRHVTKRAADHIVCQRAHTYRNYFGEIAAKEYVAKQAEAEEAAREAGKRKNRPVKPQPVAQPRKLATPDSIHLATAALYECVAFHTFDGEGPDTGPCRKLLHLNGQIPGFSIPIELPYRPGGAQASLFDLPPQGPLGKV